MRSASPLSTHAPRRIALCAAGVLGLVAAAGSALAQEDQQDQSIYYGAFFKPVCDRIAPGFKASTDKTYPIWEHQNHAAVAALEADPTFQARRREALATPPDALSVEKAQEIQNTCAGLIDLFDSVAPAQTRFAAPERTWESFRKALTAADRESLGACLAGSARKQFLPQLRAMTDEQLRRMGASIAEMKLTHRQGGIQEAVIVQRDGKMGTVTFAKVGPNWKIARM